MLKIDFTQFRIHCNGSAKNIAYWTLLYLTVLNFIKETVRVQCIILFAGTAPPWHSNLIFLESLLQTVLEYEWYTTNPHKLLPFELELLVLAAFCCVEDRDSFRWCCWHCSGGLNQRDSLLREHARYSPRSPFLIRVVHIEVLQSLMELESSPENATVVIKLTLGMSCTVRVHYTCNIFARRSV